MQICEAWSLRVCKYDCQSQTLWMWPAGKTALWWLSWSNVNRGAVSLLSVGVSVPAAHVSVSSGRALPRAHKDGVMWATGKPPGGPERSSAPPQQTEHHQSEHPPNTNNIILSISNTQNTVELKISEKHPEHSSIITSSAWARTQENRHLILGLKTLSPNHDSFLSSADWEWNTEKLHVVTKSQAVVYEVFRD